MRYKTDVYVGDFETTVFKGQTRTDVWASACVKIGTEDVKIFNTIGEQFDFLKSLKRNVIVYYHNLKFDGTFWLSYFINDLKFKQAVIKIGDGDYNVAFQDRKEMSNNSFTYNISDMGQWYRITVKVSNHIIEFRDSLKLLPFSVKKIGKSFKTKHKKLNMKYEGYRYPGCEITDEEKKYIANDVLVVKEALEFMFENGHNKLTIGACCLSEYKKIMGEDYDVFFPDLYEMELDESIYGSKTVGDYIHNSYRGGWCYLVKGKENKVYKNGTTADVNSLYPSMMSSESGNYYPVGAPKFWKGPKPVWVASDYYYFIRIRTRFYVKKGMLPFIQIKHDMKYKSTEMLMTSDVYNRKDGKYYAYYRDFDEQIQPATITITMTQTDYELFLKHYDVADFEVLDGCYFSKEIGLFDRYIERYKKIKMESTGAMRELAKLFLNNLYGKMAASPDSSYKVVFVDEEGALKYTTVKQKDKKPGYIAVGSAITSYARCFTITAAQQNYYGVDKPGFIYADTDSMHLDLSPDDVKGIREHPTEFCCWKLESCWDVGIFVRQKTYIEHVVLENRKPIEEGPYYNVKCAGMPDRCKELFMYSVQGIDDETFKHETKEKDWTETEQLFVKTPRKLEDFKIGLVVPGKLTPMRIPGGTLLVSTTYEMR